MTSQPHITPNDLRSDPELAIVDALDHVLKLTVYALVAIYPELTDTERPAWRRDDSAQGRAASHLIACGQQLECAIVGYRVAVARAAETEANEDLPF